MEWKTTLKVSVEGVAARGIMTRFIPTICGPGHVAQDQPPTIGPLIAGEEDGLPAL